MWAAHDLGHMPAAHCPDGVRRSSTNWDAGVVVVVCVHSTGCDGRLRLPDAGLREPHGVGLMGKNYPLRCCTGCGRDTMRVMYCDVCIGKANRTKRVVSDEVPACLDEACLAPIRDDYSENSFLPWVDHSHAEYHDSPDYGLSVVNPPHPRHMKLFKDRIRCA